ncbi:MAG: RNA-binding domain-containing protein [Candidatus Krumholzibacteriia bacterium]
MMQEQSIHPFGVHEGLALEFKEAAEALPKSFFATVCAFLNLDGGLIVLGVADDGAVVGIAPDAVDRMKIEIANLSNNPSKLEPPHLLFPHAEEIAGRWIIKVQVPASSQVHRSAGEVYLRGEEGDYRITDLNRIAGLVNRKLSFFTEQRVLPHLQMADLRPDLFEKSRRLMRGRVPQHPWADLVPEALLNIAGFVRKDVFTGKVGYTLAAALMFGTDEIIQSVAPGYKFDALLRRRDIERYDDRLIVRTNLIDAFDLLMGFIEKHLDDPFYLEGTAAVSLRARIFRELVANIVAHREYTSAAPATIMIYRDRVEFKNPNVPHGRGPIDPAHFTPYPKNPTICKFLIQLGRYEELGSGVNNVTKYLPFYAPGAGAPSFNEDDMFTTVVPLAPAAGEVNGGDTGEVAGEDKGEVAGEVMELLRVTKTAMSRYELQRALKLKGQANFRDRYLLPALRAGLIEMTVPDKPKSRLQKYRLTAKGRQVIGY